MIHPTHSSSQGLDPSCKDRQHSDCSMDQSPGLQHEQETELSGNTSTVSVFSTSVVDQGKSYPRPSEHLSGCSLQGPSDSLKVGSLSGVLQPSAVRPSCGPIRAPGERTFSSVRMSVSPPQGSSSRCPDSGLEQVEDNLPLSASRVSFLLGSQT